MANFYRNIPNGAQEVAGRNMNGITFDPNGNIYLYSDITDSYRQTLQQNNNTSSINIDPNTDKSFIGFYSGTPLSSLILGNNNFDSFMPDRDKSKIAGV